MYRLLAKLTCAVLIVLSYSPAAAEKTINAKESIVESIPATRDGPLTEPVQVQSADNQHSQTDDLALIRLDELRLKYLSEQYREVGEQSFVWFQAYEYESRNQQRQDVLLGIWRKQAEAFQRMKAIENSLYELNPRIFIGDRTNDVERMPFGAGSFGPWSTGLLLPRP